MPNLEISRTSIWRAMVAGLLCCAAIGCAPTSQGPELDQSKTEDEKTEQVRLYLAHAEKYRIRLHGIADRINIANADMCGDKLTNSYGFITDSLANKKDDFKEGAKKLGLHSAHSVRYVWPNSPAARAGLETNDVIRLANDVEITPGGSGAIALAQMARKAKATPLILTITKPDAPRDRLERRLESRIACDYQASHEIQDSINAFADGSRIVVSTAMMRFAESDEELALVVGHELAHNLRGHISMKVANSVPGTILDLAIAVTTGISTGGFFGNMTGSLFSPQFEEEADYVGLYAMARAGFDISDAATFWRRMATENPGMITSSGSHPTSTNRFLRLEAGMREIAEKRSSGLALVPNEKQKAKGSPAADAGPAADPEQRPR